MTTMIMLQGITAVITKMKISNAFLKITPLYTHDFSQLIQDIDAINEITQEIRLDIPNVSLCNMLYGFIDSFSLTDFNELQQLGDPIDYINFQTSTIFFTKIHSDMKKQMEDIKNQIIAKPIAIFTNKYPVTKYMNILNILIIYLNNIKQQDITMFKRIMPYQYSFHFFIIYMSYMHIFSIITDTATNVTRQAIRDVENLIELIIKILENLLFENTCDINRTYNRDETYVKIYTQLQTELHISDDLYNLIDCLKFLFEESNQESKDKSLYSKIYITDLHALFKLDKWDASFKLIKKECINFNQLLSNTDNDFCVEKISNIIEELIQLNEIFKADNKLVHILSLLCIYIKLLLLKNIYREMNSDTPNSENTDKMTELLQQRITPIEFIKKYIALISESSETLVTFEPDKQWIAQRDKTYKTLERLSQISDSSSRDGSSLAALNLDASKLEALDASSRVGSRSHSFGSSLGALSSSRVGSSLGALSVAKSGLSSSGSKSSVFGSSAHASSSSSVGSSSRDLTHDEIILIRNAIASREQHERTSQEQALVFLQKPKLADLIKKNKDANSDRHTKRPGIVNEGNTCFLNSALQLLYSIMDLRESILQIPEVAINENYEENPALALTPIGHQKNPREDTPEFQDLRRKDLLKIEQNKSTTIIQSLRTIFKSMSESQGGNVSSRVSIEQIFRTQNMGIGAQHDTEEFIGFIMSAIQVTQSMEDLFNLFKMHFVEIKTCVENNEKNVKDWSLSSIFEYRLQINQCETMQKSIMSYLKDEVISDPSNFLDEWCHNQPFSKQTNIVFNPNFKYLIINLKKTQNSISDDKKLTTAFNAKKLDTPFIVEGTISIPNYQNQSEPHIVFVLQGASYHWGTTTGGHYSYLEFDQLGSIIPIRHYNDHSVDTLSPTDARQFDIHKNGALFLYKKIQVVGAGGGMKSQLNETSSFFPKKKDELTLECVQSTHSNETLDEVPSTSSKPDNETSSFFPKKKDELTLECVQSTHSNETKWKNKYLKYKQKYLHLSKK